MAAPARLYCAAVLGALVAGACTRAAAPPDTLAQPAPAVWRAPAGRTAALDSGSARRLCAAPDSVLAGRAPCVLRDQGAPPPVRPMPQP